MNGLGHDGADHTIATLRLDDSSDQQAKRLRDKSLLDIEFNRAVLFPSFLPSFHP